MKVVYLGIILTFLLVAMSYAKPAHADSSDPVQILNVQVHPNIIKVNDTFLLDITILNNSTFPIYLTSGSCTPVFSVVFDTHAKQVYPNIACTSEAILQKVDPQNQVTISNANKPGVIYQVVQPGTGTVNITLPYFAKNQTATDYSNIYYNTSKSFQFLIHDANETFAQKPPAYFAPPLQQIKAGVASNNVKCQQDLQLIIKGEDGSPACVKPDTVTKLELRGWAAIPTTANEYKVPESFMPCNTPYPQSNTGVAVLYMPVNSIGKICVRYSNPNDAPYPVGIRIFEANNLNQDATEISTWNDLGNNTTISKGNSTVVYVIKTGNQTGSYGLTIFCVGMPFVVGYDNNSTIASSDFPWLGKTFACPLQSYQFHIDSLTGIGVKYIQ